MNDSRLTDWLNAVSRPRRILLVEDDTDTRELFKHYTRRMHCEIVEAQDGQSALAILSNPQEKIDFVFIDLVMPGIDGEELFKRIRNEPIRSLRPILPVAIFSGFIQTDTVQRIKEHGFCCFIQKPHQFNEAYIFEMLNLFHILPRSSIDALAAERSKKP